jgi:hypothetical protein
MIPIILTTAVVRMYACCSHAVRQGWQKLKLITRIFSDLFLPSSTDSVYLELKLDITKYSPLVYFDYNKGRLWVVGRYSHLLDVSTNNSDKYLSMALQPLSVFLPFSVSKSINSRDHPVAKPLPRHRTTQTQNKRTQISSLECDSNPRSQCSSRLRG